MAAILLGGIALVLVLFFIRAFIDAEPKALAKGVRQVLAGVLALAAVFLLLRESILGAVLLGIVAWAVFRGGDVWPGRWFLRRRRPPSADASSPNRTGMSRAEALAVLGLAEGAGADEIHAAHHRMMQQYHPDHGGSDYLASKINEARDVLLG